MARSLEKALVRTLVAMDRFSLPFSSVEMILISMTGLEIGQRGRSLLTGELPLKRRDERTPAAVAVIGETERGAGYSSPALRFP